MIDLSEFDFRPHPAGFIAQAFFDNGFGCSVIPEADMEHYEVAILVHENENRSHVSYTSGLTDDVFRYLTVDDVHKVIARARNLKAGTRVEAPHPFVTTH